MLLTMKSQIEAGRAMTYEAAIALDAANAGDAAAKAKVDILTPIVKSWCTDMSCEVTSIGVQIHGGMGFVEETGAAQFYRDARILPIYEGTNGIQAADLAFRKTARDGGAAALAYIESLEGRVSGKTFTEYFTDLREVVKFIAEKAAVNELDATAASAAPYLKAFGIIAGGALLSLSAEKTKNIEDQEFATAKQQTASFYAANILPLAKAHLQIALKGHEAF